MGPAASARIALPLSVLGLKRTERNGHGNSGARKTGQAHKNFITTTTGKNRPIQVLVAGSHLPLLLSPSLPSISDQHQAMLRTSPYADKVGERRCTSTHLPTYLPSKALLQMIPPAVDSGEWCEWSSGFCSSRWWQLLLLWTVPMRRVCRCFLHSAYALRINRNIHCRHVHLFCIYGTSGTIAHCKCADVRMAEHEPEREEQDRDRSGVEWRAAEMSLVRSRIWQEA